MGQISIPMLNKVGNSMFWNSMWDSKVLYTRFLKEDIYLNKFFDLILSDNLSSNTISLKNKNYKNYKFNKYFLDYKKISLYNSLFKLNKINFYSAKLWIFKFQKWLILYQFIYVPNINKEKKITKDYYFKSNTSYLYKYYMKSNFKINSFYSFYKKTLH